LLDFLQLTTVGAHVEELAAMGTNGIFDNAPVLEPVDALMAVRVVVVPSLRKTQNVPPQLAMHFSHRFTPAHT
jgi:hypothetical protein